MRERMAFVFPTAFPRQRSTATATRACIRCALIKGGTGGRRRHQIPRIAEPGGSSPLPQNFLNEVRRLVRTRAFLDDVKEYLRWTYTRFTGVVFERLPISEETTDGIPAYLREFQEQADYRFIDVPPGLLIRAKDRARVSLDTRALRLCALFETYGEYCDVLQAAQVELTKSEEDMQKQVLAWSDTGQSMRTETDLTNVNGPELFNESLTSFLE